MDDEAAGEKSTEAEVAFGHIVDAAAHRLSLLRQPAVVATHPIVFDNRGDLSEWQAVQLGSERWVLRTGSDARETPANRDDIAYCARRVGMAGTGKVAGVDRNRLRHKPSH
jgi:hypothetical protein